MFLGFWQEGQASQCFLLCSCLLVVDGWLVILENINTVITRRSLRNIWDNTELEQLFLFLQVLRPTLQTNFPSHLLPLSLHPAYFTITLLSMFSFYIPKIYITSFYIFPTKNGSYIRSCALPLYKTLYILLCQYRSFEYSILIIFHYGGHLCIQISVQVFKLYISIMLHLF